MLVATGLQKIRDLLPKKILHRKSLAHQFKFQVLGIYLTFVLRLISWKLELETETKIWTSSLLPHSSPNIFDGGYKGVDVFQDVRPGFFHRHQDYCFNLRW